MSAERIDLEEQKRDIRDSTGAAKHPGRELAMKARAGLLATRRKITIGKKRKSCPRNSVPLEVWWLLFNPNYRARHETDPGMFGVGTPERRKVQLPMFRRYCSLLDT